MGAYIWVLDRLLIEDLWMMTGVEVSRYARDDMARVSTTTVYVDTPAPAIYVHIIGWYPTDERMALPHPWYYDRVIIYGKLYTLPDST